MKKLLYSFVLSVLCSFVLMAPFGCSGDSSEEGIEGSVEDFSPVGFSEENELIPNSPVDEVDEQDSTDDPSEPDTQSVDDDPVDTGSEDVSGDPDPAPEPEPVEPPEEEPANGAIVVSSQFPSAMICGEVAPVSVEMRNIGTTTWTKEDSYSWARSTMKIPSTKPPGSGCLMTR